VPIPPLNPLHPIPVPPPTAPSTTGPGFAASGIVGSDRHDASSLAYQSVSSGRGGPQAVDWIRQLNRHALRPHLTVVLDIPSDLAAARRLVRGEPAQLYEQNEVQRALAAFYRDLAKHMPEDKVVIIDGTGTIEDVHNRIYEAYKARFND